MLYKEAFDLIVRDSVEEIEERGNVNGGAIISSENDFYVY